MWQVKAPLVLGFRGPKQELQFDADFQGTTGVRLPGAQARVAVPGRQSEA